MGGRERGKRWQEDQYWKQKPGNQRPVTTFFVSNLPGAISKSLLWKAFQPHGVVKDAYVAKKKDSRGNYFGFVRCEGVANVNETLRGMNSVKIYEAKLSVSVARYDKNHEKFAQQFIPEVPIQHPPKYQAYLTRQYVTRKVSNNVTFKDIVSGPGCNPSTSRKVLRVDERAALYPDHCIMRSVIGEAKDLEALELVKAMLKEGGYDGNPTGYIGGLKIMVVFKDKQSAVEFIRDKEDMWKRVFLSVVLWEGQEVEFDRLVSLKIMGLPLQLRDSTFFDKVGKMFGRLAQGSQFSWARPDNSDGRCWVLTKSARWVEEEIEVVWEGRQYPVWVVEEQNPGIQSVIDDLSSTILGSPAKSMESVVGGDDELEEGEIRYGQQKEPEANARSMPEVETVGMPMETEEAPIPRSVHDNLEKAAGDGKVALNVEQVPSHGEHASSTSTFRTQLWMRMFNFHRRMMRFQVAILSLAQGCIWMKNRFCRSWMLLKMLCQRKPWFRLKRLQLLMSAQNWASTSRAFKNRGVRDPRKSEWIRGLKTTHGVHFLAIQETKMGGVNRFLYSQLWGRSRFEFDSVDAVGMSGGLLSLWNPAVFNKVGVVRNRNYLVVSGNLVATGELVNVINVYAQNDPIARRGLWEELKTVKDSHPGLWILLGDFNDVRSPAERRNSEFVAINAEFFNQFIADADLSEYTMGGRQFTYRSDNGQKLSKLDRFLVCREFMNTWPGAAFLALSSAVSDHSPILLSTIPVDFGAVPTRVFNSWLELPGVLDYVDHLCRTFRFNGPADLCLAVKLKWIKVRVKDRVMEIKRAQGGQYSEKVEILEGLDLAAESRDLLPHELEKREDCRRFIMETDRLKIMDLKQKSRVRWAVEGDENSAYFHSVVNANISNNRINGLWIDGNWVTQPPLIKDYVVSFFAEKFEEPVGVRPKLTCPDITQLASAEAADLVRPFSLTEIKNAVWDCGGDKAPGPDGINFRFLRRCWDGLERDFLKMFDEFYQNASISRGCSSSFLALIPKCSDPGGLADFRPISLIGCINKVI
ncbi:putative RNA-directed DNA polymerase [Helianthus debilis subsp. tardiflorus]